MLQANRGKNNPAFKSVIDTLENLKGSLFQKLLQIVSPKEPLAVICHGDFYINNMLFRSVTASSDFTLKQIYVEK